MRKKQFGFTLIELILFILITSILATAVLLSYVSAMSNSPALMQNTIATETAKQCAELYLGQRQVYGYSSVSGANCTNPLTIPSLCTVPSGYTLTASCSPTTLRGDSNYVTLSFAVTGSGNANLTLLLGKY